MNVLTKFARLQVCSIIQAMAAVPAKIALASVNADCNIFSEVNTDCKFFVYSIDEWDKLKRVY